MAKSNMYQYELFGEKSRFFFNKFPYIDYDVLNDGKKQKIRNFLKRFDFREKIRGYGSIYTKWVLRDEDTPEVIAHKLYNSTHYYWIILMINKIHDPFFNFPLSENELIEYVDKKYGPENRHAIHHYETIYSAELSAPPAGIVVDKYYPHAKKDVDNIEYEAKKNDEKRHILLLEPQYLEQVLMEFDTIMESDFTRVK
jgi:hypothetical protein